MSSLLPFSLQESYEVSLVSLDSVGEPASPLLLPPTAAADAAATTATAATAESMLLLLLLLLLLLPFLSRFGEALGDDLGDALGDPAGRRPELLLLLPARVPDLVVLRLPLCLVLLRLLSPLLRCCLLWLPPLLPLPLLGRRDDDLCGLGTASSAASGPPIAAAAVAAAVADLSGSGRSASPDDDCGGAECLLLLPLFSEDLDDFFLCCLELPPLVVEVLRPSLRVPLLLFLLPLRLLRDGDEAVVAVLAGADSGAAAVASSSPPMPDEASGSGFSQPSPRGIMECYAIPRMREGGMETCQLLSHSLVGMQHRS